MAENVDDTRRRLLDAAGLEFAEKGFEGATVRSICDRANANIAAVNYHFGGKEALYERTLVETHACDQVEIDPALYQGLAPEQQLSVFIRQFLSKVVGLSEADDWRRTLMLREMANPSSASDTLVREVIRPRYEMLGHILRQLCPEADERKLAALRFSVVGQCLFYKIVGRMAQKLTGPDLFAQLDLDYLARHITTLILAALGRGPSLNEPVEAAGRALENSR
jgi:TetR/AcrR family transcriptional regulator, regulator of cefoperazone and chloramphenicol sensitivity